MKKNNLSDEFYTFLQKIILLSTIKYIAFDSSLAAWSQGLFILLCIIGALFIGISLSQILERQGVYKKEVSTRKAVIVYLFLVVLSTVSVSVLFLVTPLLPKI